MTTLSIAGVPKEDKARLEGGDQGLKSRALVVLEAKFEATPARYIFNFYSRALQLSFGDSPMRGLGGVSNLWVSGLINGNSLRRIPIAMFSLGLWANRLASFRSGKPAHPNIG